MNKKTIIAVATLLALPLMSFAAFDAGPPPSTQQNLTINTLIDKIFAILWPIAVAFFIIMFIIASFMFFTAQGDPDGVGKARQFVIWGVVGVVIALLAFAIPFMVKNTLGIV